MLFYFPSLPAKEIIPKRENGKLNRIGFDDLITISLDV